MKNPRGRKPGSGAGKQSKLEDELFKGMIAFAIDTAFDVVAVFKGPHWKLTEEQSEQLADIYEKAINASGKYYGQIRQLFNQVIPFVGVIVCTGAVIAKKLEEDRIIARIKSEQGVEGANNGYYPGTVRGGSTVDEHGQTVIYPHSLNLDPGGN